MPILFWVNIIKESPDNISLIVPVISGKKDVHDVPLKAVNPEVVNAIIKFLYFSTLVIELAGITGAETIVHESGKIDLYCLLLELLSHFVYLQKNGCF